MRPAHSTRQSPWIPDFPQQATMPHSPGPQPSRQSGRELAEAQILAALEGSSGAARSSPRSDLFTVSLDVFYLSLPICCAGHRLPAAEDS